MSRKKPAAGEIIEAKCTRCRDVRNHTIVAMVGERVVRVRCNTCDGEHNYREPAAPRAAAPKGTAAKAETPRRTTRAAADPHAAERTAWAELSPNLHHEGATPYRMDGAYRVNEQIAHPVFGLGVVQRVVSGKVEVLFQDGKKLLRSR